MPLYTDSAVIDAIQAESRACYGRPGAGVRLRDVAIRLYEATRDPREPYYLEPAIAGTRRQINSLVRRNIAQRGRDRQGSFYRVASR
jgi:hypothetical protein